MASDTVRIPVPNELDAVAGLEAIVGFPNVLGAIDGALVRIARPHEYEGWYCRKVFPALNVQAVVDHEMRFRSVSIRCGSTNDQSAWNVGGGNRIIECYSIRLCIQCELNLRFMNQCTRSKGEVAMLCEVLRPMCIDVLVQMCGLLVIFLDHVVGYWVCHWLL
ncbi:TPA: hypothetical protein N0F65_002293 [Lagenidium giganteum]|uniref:DDE Tnp4 domain-containing protein n=1 Tax=Lagenidium giganteum TaxID=4803 RepID=A0AAV2Z750_9STRA|nr:TPA: hypothetical protein N0F65_002293 [Lagenidium giganteum]